MDQLTLWEGAVFDAVIDECLSEASICHDEFQINKRVGLQVMLHGVYLQTGNRTEKEKRNRLGGRLFGFKFGNHSVNAGIRFSILSIRTLKYVNTFFGGELHGSEKFDYSNLAYEPLLVSKA